MPGGKNSQTAQRSQKKGKGKSRRNRGAILPLQGTGVASVIEGGKGLLTRYRVSGKGRGVK